MTIKELLKGIVVSWDLDDDLEFMKFLWLARKKLKLTLADDKEREEENEVIKANFPDLFND